MLYLRLIGARIRAQMQYKTSFWLELISFGLMTALEFVVVLMLFWRFPTIGGWTVGEVAVLYGLSACSFGVAEMVGRGFDAPFELMMLHGTFDSVLTRPVSAFVQVLGSEFQLRRLGRAMQGGFVLIYGLSQSQIDWTWPKVLLLMITFGAGVVIYMAVQVIGATICFWTIKTPEIMFVFTSGGDYLVSYPLSIYNRWVRGIFLFVVPIAFVNYPTALVLLNRRDPLGLPASLAWAAPFVAAAFMGIALIIWRFGVSKYTSSGS